MRLVGAEVLKLVRRRGLMAWTLLLTVGVITVVEIVLIVLHAVNAAHHGPAGGPSNFRGAAESLALLGTLTAVLIGATAGSQDVGNGVFRDLVVTGRKRATLFNVRLPGAFQRNDRAGIREDMDRVFELFPRLQERRTQKAGTMSGGEQQMCAIGRALMARPKLLLLDEPSLGLAPIFVERIFDIIKQINEQGTSILLVEQNALMALDAANRGYVLETGRIVLADSAASLKTNEQVRKTYLGEV